MEKYLNKRNNTTLQCWRNIGRSRRDYYRNHKNVCYISNAIVRGENINEINYIIGCNLKNRGNDDFCKRKIQTRKSENLLAFEVIEDQICKSVNIGSTSSIRKVVWFGIGKESVWPWTLANIRRLLVACLPFGFVCRELRNWTATSGESSFAF